MPQSRFESVHVDLVGPLPQSNGYTALFTVIDRFSRWPAAVPVADTTAQSCARAFLHGWVAWCGVPVTITSDRGPQFVSEIWRAMAHSSDLMLVRPQPTIHNTMGWMRGSIAL